MRRNKPKKITIDSPVSNASKPAKLRNSSDYSKRIRMFKVLLVVFVLVVVIATIGTLLFKDRSETNDGEAINSVENQISINSGSVESAQSQDEKITSLLFLAGDYMQAGQYDSAITNYQVVLELDPNNQQALGGLILCYHEKKDKDNSIKYLEEMIKLLESRQEKNEELISYYKNMLENARKDMFSLGTNTGASRENG